VGPFVLARVAWDAVRVGAAGLRQRGCRPAAAPRLVGYRPRGSGRLPPRSRHVPPAASSGCGGAFSLQMAARSAASASSHVSRARPGWRARRACP
jgi:hypothetical protein